MRCFILALCLLYAPLSTADIVNCNGRWTNKPCEVGAAARLPEKPLDPRYSAADYSQKKQFLLSVSAYALELSRLGITFPASDIERYCLEADRSLKACQEMFETTRDSFAPALSAAQQRVESEKLQSKPAEAEPPKSINSEQTNNVQVIDNRGDEIIHVPPPYRREDSHRDHGSFNHLDNSNNQESTRRHGRDKNADSAQKGLETTGIPSTIRNEVQSLRDSNDANTSKLAGSAKKSR